MRKLTKKKVEINDQVDLLVQKYMTMSGKDLNEVVNDALKAYLAQHLSQRVVKETLKRKDPSDAKYLDEMFKDNINNDCYGNF